MNSHIETVQSIYEAFGRGDVPAILEHLADNIRWEQWADNTVQKAGVSWMQPRHGKEGAAAFFTVIATELAVKEFSVLSIMGNETQVAAEFVIACDVPATGGYYGTKKCIYGRLMRKVK